ncbi:hypothetical protein MsAc7_09200 [Methanolapillus millepedarum]|uniref:Uncharacterized protein n=1 Tax=Methanolapillus millepedarum TaxID=3028296 RepID=A0AA96ZU69_9EURY|nr:hypothetical protein MsAc7_09200 [Methanosarcinaceae archaeon Ac7]
MKKFQNRQTSKKSCFELKFKKEKIFLKRVAYVSFNVKNLKFFLQPFIKDRIIS